MAELNSLALVMRQKVINGEELLPDRVTTNNPHNEDVNDDELRALWRDTM